MKKLFPYIIICLVTALVLWLANRMPESKPELPPTVYQNQIQSFTNVPNVPQGEFKYGGSTTWAQIRKQVDPELQSALSNNFKLTYVDPSPGETPGSNTGIRMLLNNKLDFAVSSRQLRDDEKQQGLIEKEVAFDSIAIAVNPKLELRKQGLTIDELKGIYTGQITNWTQFGGPNETIKPYTRHPEDGGTVDFFLKEVLKIKVEDLRAEFVDRTTSGEGNGIYKVAHNLGGIYYASAPEIVEQCEIKPFPLGETPEKFIPPYKPPYLPPDKCRQYKSKVKVNIEEFRNGRYPIKRKLYVIIKQDEPTKQQAGEAYAKLLQTAKGQKLLEKAGFIKIY
jgi:phosphate transport system substrate-binding protein